VYDPLPPPTTSYVSTVGSDTAPPPFATLPVATFAETDLTPATDPLLITGASGQPMFVVDNRIANVNNLREGVYQITRKLSYDSYTGDPVHRFYQMWQQFDCRDSNVHGGIPADARTTFSPGWKSRLGPAATGPRSHRTSTT
jgi:phospholipase C